MESFKEFAQQGYFTNINSDEFVIQGMKSNLMEAIENSREEPEEKKEWLGVKRSYPPTEIATEYGVILLFKYVRFMRHLFPQKYTSDKKCIDILKNLKMFYSSIYHGDVFLGELDDGLEQTFNSIFTKHENNIKKLYIELSKTLGEQIVRTHDSHIDLWQVGSNPEMSDRWIKNNPKELRGSPRLKQNLLQTEEYFHKTRPVEPNEHGDESFHKDLYYKSAYVEYYRFKAFVYLVNDLGEKHDIPNHDYRATQTISMNNTNAKRLFDLVYNVSQVHNDSDKGVNPIKNELNVLHSLKEAKKFRLQQAGGFGGTNANIGHLFSNIKTVKDILGTFQIDITKDYAIFSNKELHFSKFYADAIKNFYSSYIYHKEGTNPIFDRLCPADIFFVRNKSNVENFKQFIQETSSLKWIEKTFNHLLESSSATIFQVKWNELVDKGEMLPFSLKMIGATKESSIKMHKPIDPDRINAIADRILNIGIDKANYDTINSIVSTLKSDRLAKLSMSMDDKYIHYKFQMNLHSFKITQAPNNSPSISMQFFSNRVDVINIDSLQGLAGLLLMSRTQTSSSRNGSVSIGVSRALEKFLRPYGLPKLSRFVGVISQFAGIQRTNFAKPMFSYYFEPTVIGNKQMNVPMFEFSFPIEMLQEIQEPGTKYKLKSFNPDQSTIIDSEIFLISCMMGGFGDVLKLIVNGLTERLIDSHDDVTTLFKKEHHYLERKDLFPGAKLLLSSYIVNNPHAAIAISSICAGTSPISLNHYKISD